MALTEKSRSAIYQGLSNVVDEEAVQEMLSHFPARDVEEPVTKEFLRAEMAGLEQRLGERVNRAQAWNFLAMTALAGTIIAAVRI